MTTPIPDPGLIACHIDESAGMDPTVPGNGPTTPCDVCGVAFGPGDLWNYHARLGVYVHSKCAADFPVRGEDISTHTVLWGQIPDAPEAARPAAPTVPATPPVGVETSEGSTGPQTGAGEVGLGDAIRAIIPATYTDDGYFGVTALEIGEFADRADALERERAKFEAWGERCAEAHGNALKVIDRLNDESTRQSETIGRVRDLLSDFNDSDVTQDDLRAALDGAQ